MGKRIVILAGGTGGHVFPALAVAQAMREQGWQVTWMGTQKGLESRVVPEQGIAIDWLPVAGIRGKGLLAKGKALLLLLAALVAAWRILNRRKPQVVLGLGGFVAGPGGVAAKLLGIPLVIHEQNRIPGTTNRLLAKLATQVLEAFPNSFKPQSQAICTGNPLRTAFLQNLAGKPDSQDSSTHILIVGGSLGAKVLNEVVPEAMAQLEQVKVWHQTGADMQAQVEKHYLALAVDAKVSAFIEDMASAYAWADLVVCRAGAMTVSEVAAAGVPAIFIPLPHAIDDHQVANARYLTDAGAGQLLLQKDLTPASLLACIKLMMAQLDTTAQSVKALARLDATELVVQTCIDKAKP
ncbi:MAG: undecaprenyldiphospho-muramoylpentapeptide beta-N-acetylglucosaminyltransferase [Methylococcaceae bacterium]|jgi:UDP-N-acetylglucosamine--N-acetylmuramyl-(pentapeptide) pyrophosphoryl-undecaprenol N-acetylglucosamine transferase